MGELNIRRAAEQDIPVIGRLLYQVHKVHSDARPDLFKAGAKKYTDDQLRQILTDGLRPVFVAEKDGSILGYAFCVHQQHTGSGNMTDVKTLYIDDLCVDENCRGRQVGKSLYEAVLDLARSAGCYNVTLNVWSCNPGAMRFYEKCGLKQQKVGMELIL